MCSCFGAFILCLLLFQLSVCIALDMTNIQKFVFHISPQKQEYLLEWPWHGDFNEFSHCKFLWSNEKKNQYFLVERKMALYLVL